MYRTGLRLTRHQGTISKSWGIEDPVENVSVQHMDWIVV